MPATRNEQLAVPERVDDAMPGADRLTYEVGGGIGRAIAGHEDQETRGPAPWGGWRR